jgi:hypothetical protein
MKSTENVENCLTIPKELNMETGGNRLTFNSFRVVALTLATP